LLGSSVVIDDNLNNKQACELPLIGVKPLSLSENMELFKSHIAKGGVRIIC